jgi:ubiquinone/menaquinone biosynthesis C-methylase UbiE
VLLNGERAQRLAMLEFDHAAQPVRRVDRCNLCGNDRFVVLTHRDRYGFGSSASCCRRCGLVFLDPVLTDEAYAAFYRSTYRPLVSAYHGRRIDAETIEEEQHDYAAALGDLLAQFLAPGGELLDVGGSTGVVAEHLAGRFELRAAVLDPAPAELERAAARGLETIVGTGESYDPGDRRFDAVLLCQTVDHLLNVAGVLGKARRLLADDGLLFVDVVDFRAAYLRAWSIEDATKVDHPHYFTDATIRAYLARTGFDVVRSDFAADHLHVGYVCRPADPEPDALPDPATVERLLDEVRRVQNAPGPS